jgi:hypothetical protein
MLPIYSGARRDVAAVARTLRCIFHRGTGVPNVSARRHIVSNAMLVSHGPLLKTFPHGEEKGTMGLLMILVCRECILEDLEHMSSRQMI